MEMAEVVNRIGEMMNSSDDYVWVITDQAMTSHSDVMIERVSKGVTFRSLIHERINSSQVRVFGKNVERRVAPSIPALVVVTEKEAFVSFLAIDGSLVHSGFFGSNPAFMRWITDLFLYFWDQTKRGYSQANSQT
jgi:predicted transcriptional regulator